MPGRAEPTAAELLAISKLPGSSFGPPPDPQYPKPRFIGMPASRFNSVCAEKVYRDQIIGDNNKRANFEAAAPLLHKDGKVDIQSADNLCDTIPGGRSILRTYSRMGFTFCPFTSRVLAPAVYGEVRAPGPDDPIFPPASLHRPTTVPAVPSGSQVLESSLHHGRSRPRTSSSSRSRRSATAMAAGPEVMRRTPTASVCSSPSGVRGLLPRSSSTPAGGIGGPWAQVSGLVFPLSQTASSHAAQKYEGDLIRSIRSRGCSALTIG